MKYLKNPGGLILYRLDGNMHLSYILVIIVGKSSKELVCNSTGSNAELEHHGSEEHTIVGAGVLFRTRGHYLTHHTLMLYSHQKYANLHPISPVTIVSRSRYLCCGTSSQKCISHVQQQGILRSSLMGRDSYSIHHWHECRRSCQY